MFKKNTAQELYFLLLSTAGAVVTGATVTGYRTIDNGSQEAVSGTFTELGNGQYRFNGAAGDFNGDEVGLLFTATGAVPVSVSVKTATKLVSELQDPTVATIQSGLASQASVDDIPTNAELATALAGADDVILARIGSPAGASLIADLGTATSATQSIILNVKAQTDKIVFNGENDVVASLGTESVTLTSPAQAALVSAIWAALTSGLTTANSIGKRLVDFVTTLVYSTPPTTSEIKTAIEAGGGSIALIKAKTDTIPTSPAAVTDIPTAAAIKTALEADGSKIDHLWEMTEDDDGTRRLTTNALEQAPTGGSAPTAVAIRQEIDANSTQLAAIKAKSDGLNFTGTDVKATLDGETVALTAGHGLALESTLTAIKGGTWSTETLKAIKDAVDQKLDTSGYTAPPSAASIAAAVDASTVIAKEATLVVVGDVVQQDYVIDKTTTPWTLKTYKKGTSTLLDTKYLYTNDDAPVDSAIVPIIKQLETAL